MKLPKSKWTIVGLASLWLAATPLASYVYYAAELQRGAYPPDADSISIPIFQEALSIVILSPALALLVWLAVRRYRAAGSFFAWAPGAPMRSLLWTAGLGVGGLALLWEAGRQGLSGHVLPAVHSIVGVYVASALRASAVAGLEMAPPNKGVHLTRSTFASASRLRRGPCR